MSTNRVTCDEHNGKQNLWLKRLLSHRHTQATASQTRECRKLQFPLEIVRIGLDTFRTEKPTLSAGKLYQIWEDDLPLDQFLIDPDLGPEQRSLLLSAIERRVLRSHIARLGLPLARRRRAVSVSVVICTRDRPQELARCLASFGDQVRQPDEIIVVDNASLSAETKAVAEAAGATYVREDRPGLDFARNAGARRAKSDILAYTDDDVVLHPQWLERIVEAFDEPDIEAVTGLVLPAEIHTEAQWIFESQWGFGRGFKRRDFTPDSYERVKRHGFASWDIGAGASMAFRKSLFDRIGYFDERLDVGAAGCSGDSEYWNRIVHYGGTCRYEPAVVAFHYHRRDITGLRKQIAAYMSGHTAALLVQYENTGEFGNLRRLISGVPRYLLRLLVSRLVRGPTLRNCTVIEQIMGSMRGVKFYLTAKRPALIKPVHLERTAFLSANGFEEPLVSVIVPAYNASRTLERTLRSALAQTHQNLEVIVVDDGSTDETASIVSRYILQDSRIKLVQQTNRGLAEARNAGILSAAGQFIAPLDADDLWHPEKIERQMQVMHRMGSACGLVYGDSLEIDDDDRVMYTSRQPLPSGDVLALLMLMNFVGNGSSPLMRKAALIEAGMYDPGLKLQGAQGCEDFQMQMRIAEHHDFGAVHTALTGYRVGSQNMSADIKRMIRSHWLAIEPYMSRYPEHRETIATGHFYLALWYGMRALRSATPLTGLSVIQQLIVERPRQTIKMLLDTLVASFRNRFHKANGVAYPALFAQPAKPVLDKGRNA